MRMCRKCHEGQKKQGGYLSPGDEIVKQAECSIHPRLDNWRVARTVKALLAWGMDGKGSTITVGHPGVVGVQRMTFGLGDGWVHLRNAKLKLSDYEVPFIDLLLKEGMIEGRECVRCIDGVEPTAVRVTMKGRVWLRELEVRAEATKKAEAALEVEKIEAGLA